MLAESPPPGKFKIDLKGQLCYSKAEYPTLQDAMDKFLSEEFNFEFCNGQCPFAPLNSCIALHLNPGSTVNETANDWCLSGLLKFQWLCSTSPQPGGGPVIFGNPQPITPDEPGITNSHIFPNPSHGLSELIIENSTAVQHLELVIHNMLGQVISRKQFQDLPAGTNTFPIEMLESQNGLYSLTLLIDGKYTDEIKLLIQK